MLKGKAGKQHKDFIPFHHIARGSLFEVVSLQVILESLEWINEEKQKALAAEAEETTKMLNALIKSMR